MPVRNDQLAVMLRDFARRANQWADVLEKESELGDTGLALKPLITLLETPSSVEERGSFFVTADRLPSTSLPYAETFRRVRESTDPEMVAYREAANRKEPLPPASPATASVGQSLPWRRGDYFFCEECRQRKQWFADTPPWRGAICRSCYNAELARIEAARGKKA
jgi:hypothetical protein